MCHSNSLKLIILVIGLYKLLGMTFLDWIFSMMIVLSFIVDSDFTLSKTIVFPMYGESELFLKMFFMFNQIKCYMLFYVVVAMK